MLLSLLQNGAQQIIQPALTLYLLDVGSHNHSLGLAQLNCLGHLPAVSPQQTLDTSIP